mgnify:CR=1 FL=1
MTNLKDVVVQKLETIGINIHDMAKIVYKLQKKYYKDLNYQECYDAIDKILSKREVIHTILTGYSLDRLAEENKLEKNINDIIINDDSRYGIDEILSLSIVNIYGSIALTNFGYLDKVKPSVIGKLDKIGKEKEKCHTFMDDIISAIVASGCSKIAHSQK